MANEEKYEYVKRSRREIFTNNFVGGIAWAFGATVGLALIVAILGLALKNVNLVPFVGNFLADVVKFVILKNSQLFAR